MTLRVGMTARAMLPPPKKKHRTQPRAARAPETETPRGREGEHCLLCDGILYAKNLCRLHYNKAWRMGLDPEKLRNLADLPARLIGGMQVSPRISPAAHARLEKGVAQGLAKSVYKMAARVLEDWRPPEEPTEQ